MREGESPLPFQGTCRRPQVFTIIPKEDAVQARRSLGSHTALVRILALLLIACMTWGEFLNSWVF